MSLEVSLITPRLDGKQKELKTVESDKAADTKYLQSGKYKAKENHVG
jgi:hypothetical protein